jgi:5-methylcytosine-specific restriction endonuclease McrA
MTSKQSKAKQAYDKEYNARPEQVKKRAQRNAARAAYEKKHGDLPSNVDVNHRTPLKKGGSNSMSNLEATSQKDNRGWRKGQSGYTPKKG